MEKITSFFVKNYKLSLVLTFFIVAVGFMGLKKMNAESYPSVDFAMAQITTYYKGASPEDIEALITKPIEDEIRTVSGLKDVKSISQTGQSTILVRIDMDNVDEKKVMDDLQKSVQRVTKLPEDLLEQPKFLEMKSDEFPAIEIAIIGSNDRRFRDEVADLLKEEIEDNDFVKDVRPSGYREREFTIELDLKMLESLHIGVTEILNKVALRNINVPGGDIETSDYKRLVRVEGKIRNEKELQDLVVRSNFNGQVVKLKDVARVLDNMEKPKNLTSHNSRPATLLVVNKKGGADTIKLADEVFKVVERFSKLYKDKLEFAVYNNEANKVRAKLDVLSSNAVSGLILVLIFLLIFMPGWVGVMASISLPLSIFATLGIMPSFGMNLDSITILALIISIGMLVDNSIVITDSFVQYKREGMSTHDAIVATISQLWAPITATAFTTIAAFVPMLVTKGIMGEFIKYIPIVVTISLLVSLLESFLFLPVRLSFVGHLVKSQTLESKVDWFEKYILKFEKLMNWVVKHRYLSALMFGGVIFGSLALMVFGNKFYLFPAEQTEVYLARVETPKGTPLIKTLDIISRLSVDIKAALPKEYREVVGRAGISKMGPTDPKGGEGDNQGLISIYVNDYAKYNVAYTEVLKKLRTIPTAEYGEVIFEEMVNGPPVGAPINVTFRSNDLSSLKNLLDELIVKLKMIPGIRDLKIDDVVSEDDVYVNIDYELADQLGVNVSDLGTTVRSALAGIPISDVTLKNKEIKLNVKFKDQYRETVEDLSQVMIMDRVGNLIPLGKIASFDLKDGTPNIKRFDFKRSKTLLGNVDGVTINSQMANKKVVEIFDSLKARYPEVTIVFGGEEENTKESMQSLGEASVLAGIGIFALLVFMFKSFLTPFIIMSTIPLGLVGFSIAFFFHGRPISFMSLVGIIGLAGIIVNSGIVLIDFIQTMRKQTNLSLHEILVKASGKRLRAVVTTSLTTVSGLFPTAYGIGGADAMLIPMTLALAWGLTSGTILTLIWIPAGYAILEDWSAFLDKHLVSKFKRVDL